MKTRKLIKFTALSIIALAVTSLSSCLKDPRFVDYASSTPFVELPLDASNGSFTAAAYAIVSTPSSLPVVVNYAAAKPRTSPLTVTLKVDAAALAAYNTANGTSFTMLPAADYSIPSLTVTIPAGQNTATLNILINSSLVDPAGSFILPISIADGGGVAISVSSTLLYNVQAKNQYDGNYASTGYLFHPSSPRAINATYAYGTAGAAAVKAPFGDLGGSNYYFDMTITGSVLSNWIAVGSCPGPTSTGAGNSGFMTLDNPGGTDYTTSLPNAPGTAPYTSANYNNTYNASTKTFWLHYGYIASGATNQTQTGFTRQAYVQAVKQ